VRQADDDAQVCWRPLFHTRHGTSPFAILFPKFPACNSGIDLTIEIHLSVTRAIAGSFVFESREALHATKQRSAASAVPRNCNIENTSTQDPYQFTL
jgi:hypothetical protein